AEVAIFVALMVAASWMSIPFYPVPLTFQTVVSVLAGLLLGWKKGTAAMLIYLFMGLVCFIPVFADHTLAGFAYALKPSFGYIIGFVFAAFTGGMIVSVNKVSPLWRYVVAGIAAFFVNYIIGIPYFAVVWHFLFGNTALGGAVLTYNVIYMPKDLLLSILAGLLAKRVVPLIRKDAVRGPSLTEKIKNK
ncbi:MAG: biotin transporter BioY, partial [Clostridia bacterium]|nr:biotin transporter BioY [Clostridia bacterium]